MVNYNNSAGSSIKPTDPYLKTATQPTHCLLADMFKNTGSQPNARLSVNSLKRHSASAQPSYSAAFALPAQMPGQLPAEFNEVRHQNLSVAHKEKTITSAFSSKPRPTAKAGHKPDESGCSLIPCSREDNITAVYPQAEALSTIRSGQPINFGDPLFTENAAIGHISPTDTFFIKEAGIYELHYSLNYESPTPHMLVFGFESFPQSYFKQQITNAPARGKLNTTVRLLLDTGTSLRLVLVDDPTLSTIESALVSNAMLEIKLLYRLNLNCPAYSSNNSEKNFQSENHFFQAAKT
ncbi:hypothetical protein ACS3UN_03580 [Oscillospiraceae bacterium LTW-04]|nr:hypothetical protein RBH76_06885 [Oscillospiraceae bacterium MB24-C1]